MPRPGRPPKDGFIAFRAGRCRGRAACDGAVFVLAAGAGAASGAWADKSEAREGVPEIGRRSRLLSGTDEGRDLIFGKLERRDAAEGRDISERGGLREFFGRRRLPFARMRRKRGEEVVENGKIRPAATGSRRKKKEDSP